MCQRTVADADDRTPFSEIGTELLILFNSCPKSVEPLGHNFAREAGDIDRSLVDFDTGHDALFGEKLGERRAVEAAVRMVSSKRITPLMASSRPLVVKHIAIGAAILIIGLNLYAVEASLDRPHALIGREDSFSFATIDCATVSNSCLTFLIPPYKK